MPSLDAFCESYVNSILEPIMYEELCFEMSVAYSELVDIGDFDVLSYILLFVQPYVDEIRIL